MESKHREIIEKFTSELVGNVIPRDTLPYLPCLTPDDREAIQYRQDREGPRSAVPTLLDRLQKRSGSFGQFLRALDATGCEHLKKKLLYANRPKTGGQAIGGPQTQETAEVSSSTSETDTRYYQSQMSHPSEETDYSHYSEFDILVCYAPQDRETAYEMMEQMERYNLRVCIDEVHFTIGKAFADNICDFIRCSKTIVFLLTKDFFDKKWSHWEMQHALLEFLEKQSSPKKKKIIPILLKQCEIPDALRPYTPLDFQQSRDWRRLATAVQGYARANANVTDDDVRNNATNDVTNNVTNKDVKNNDATNNDVTNNDVTNNDVTNNDATNNDVTNNDITNNDVTNSVANDVTYEVNNDAANNVTSDEVPNVTAEPVHSTTGPTGQSTN